MALHVELERTPDVPGLREQADAVARELESAWLGDGHPFELVWRRGFVDSVKIGHHGG